MRVRQRLPVRQIAETGTMFSSQSYPLIQSNTCQLPLLPNRHQTAIRWSNPVRCHHFMVAPPPCSQRDSSWVTTSLMESECHGLQYFPDVFHADWDQLLRH